MQERSFKPAWWLPQAHLQTLWPALFSGSQRIQSIQERLELADGDFLDINWVGKGTGPLVLILHGLGGSIHSPYAQRILRAVDQQGWRGVLIHFRGCSGEPNRLPRAYHSGETTDFDHVVGEIRKREPNTPIFAIGYSLGGNVLMKWLGEKGSSAGLTAAIGVSVPFDLYKVAERLNQGFSRLYQEWLIRGLVKDHIQKFKKIPSPLDLSKIKQLKTFWEFDDQITAPLHGFKGVGDYYSKSSSRQYLKNIAVPTLVIHAEDDPFMTPEVIPELHEISSTITLEVTKQGGHVGFVGGSLPWRPNYWLENRIMSYLGPFI